MRRKSGLKATAIAVSSCAAFRPPSSRAMSAASNTSSPSATDDANPNRDDGITEQCAFQLRQNRDEWREVHPPQSQMPPHCHVEELVALESVW